MSTQKQHKTKARRDRRRVNLAIKTKKLLACPQCGQPKRSHQTCAFCGSYKGREVVRTVKKTKKKK